MTRYKVLKNFRWSDLHLEADQVLTVEDCALIDDTKPKGTAQISLEENPETTTVVSAKAVDVMLMLKNIAEC
jgi:hypothetical protein